MDWNKFFIGDYARTWKAAPDELTSVILALRRQGQEDLRQVQGEDGLYSEFQANQDKTFISGQKFGEGEIILGVVARPFNLRNQEAEEFKDSRLTGSTKWDSVLITK